MAGISVPSFQLIYALFLLSPGFLGYKSAIHFGKITKKYDRFEKTFYTLFGSGLSTFIVLLVYSISSQESLTETVTSTYPLIDLTLAWFIIAGVSASGGIAIGLFWDKFKYRGRDTRKEDTWQLIFDNKETPTEVRAITTEGSEIHGYIYVNDTEPHGKDLLLQYPREIIRNEFGNVVEEVAIGEFVFLSEAETSHIFFETDIDI